MPYISRERRVAITCGGEHPKSVGELNYAITMLVQRYVRRNAIAGDKISGQPTYQDVNDVLGALEGAKLEFYRRVAAPYEDTKIAQNGDVYIS